MCWASETIEKIGVDLPLDETDRLLIAQFNGAVEPAAASVTVSTDRGRTWTTSMIDEPIVAVVPAKWLVAVTNTEATGRCFSPPLTEHRGIRLSN
jgi:hypothetical protein